MRVIDADFAADGDAIRAIRVAVFVEEQGVPLELEMDDRDEHCAHVLALADDGRAVGTGRLDVAYGKVGRVAVLADARRSGIGAAIMARLHGLARDAGLESVWCNAQSAAVPFYASLGYRVTSAPFAEAGIEHVRMEASISQ
jgi:predicted GNAT family N-acyltransferase